MDYLTRDEVREMILAVCREVQQNEQRLCQLDSYVGDGDHGSTMARGFRAVEKALGEPGHDSIDALFYCTAEALEEAMGGAIGPIFASLFEAAGDVCQGKPQFGAEELRSALQEGYDAVRDIGGAKPGDRTMLDALAPAAEAAETACGQGLTLPETAQAAAEAARQGAERTASMVAKKGRARFLGEKSLGHQDAGATSLAVVLGAVAAYCSH